MLPDEDVTNPEEEVTTPEPEVDPAPETDTPEPEGEETPEFDEIEYEGKTYSLPKELKDALLRQSDYTKKTQGLAQELEQTKAERDAHAKAAKLNTELFEQRADLRALDRRIASFGNVDWAKLDASDPVRAMALTRQLQQAQMAREQLKNDISGKETELSSTQEREFATLWEKGNATLAKQIPNWGNDKAREIGNFATGKLGYTAEQLQRARPNDLYTLHLAQIGLQFINNQRAPKPAPETPAVEPVTQIRPRRSQRSGEPDPEKNPEGWVKWRNQQQQAARR